MVGSVLFKERRARKKDNVSMAQELLLLPVETKNKKTTIKKKLKNVLAKYCSVGDWLGLGAIFSNSCLQLREG